MLEQKKPPRLPIQPNIFSQKVVENYEIIWKQYIHQALKQKSHWNHEKILYWRPFTCTTSDDVAHNEKHFPDKRHYTFS